MESKAHLYMFLHHQHENHLHLLPVEPRTLVLLTLHLPVNDGCFVSNIGIKEKLYAYTDKVVRIIRECSLLIRAIISVK